jgi:hypothetical protein
LNQAISQAIIDLHEKLAAYVINHRCMIVSENAWAVVAEDKTSLR